MIMDNEHKYSVNMVSNRCWDDTSSQLQNSNVPGGYNIKGFSMTIQKVVVPTFIPYRRWIRERNSFSFFIFPPDCIVLACKLLKKRAIWSWTQYDLTFHCIPLKMLREKIRVMAEMYWKHEKISFVIICRTIWEMFDIWEDDTYAIGIL